MRLTLPTDSEVRKGIPLLRGFFRYFPAAIMGAARHSQKGNDKHNPGEDLHHARGKSSDHGDCILRHQMDLEDLQAHLERTFATGKEFDEVVDAILAEADAQVWRSSAQSQELYERFGRAPLAPGAREPAPRFDGFYLFDNAAAAIDGDDEDTIRIQLK